MNYNRIFLIFMIFFLLSSQIVKADSDGLKLTIKSLDYKKNALVKVTIENFSDHPIVVALLFICEDYYIRFDIRNEEGEKIAFSGIEYKIKISSKDYLSMQPAASYSQEIDLAQYYHMPSGVYTVTAHYELSKWRRNESFIWTGRLSSNQIKLAIP